MLLRLGLEFRRLTLLASDGLPIDPAMGWAALSPAGEGAGWLPGERGCLVSRGRGCRASPPRSWPPSPISHRLLWCLVPHPCSPASVYAGSRLGASGRNPRFAVQALPRLS